jgi:hypothetical protein
MAALDAEVLDVGGTGLRHAKAVETEEHRERGVINGRTARR